VPEFETVKLCEDCKPKFTLPTFQLFMLISKFGIPGVAVVVVVDAVVVVVVVGSVVVVVEVVVVVVGSVVVVVVGSVVVVVVEVVVVGGVEQTDPEHVPEQHSLLKEHDTPSEKQPGAVVVVEVVVVVVVVVVGVEHTQLEQEPEQQSLFETQPVPTLKQPGRVVAVVVEVVVVVAPVVVVADVVVVAPTPFTSLLKSTSDRDTIVLKPAPAMFFDTVPAPSAAVFKPATPGSKEIQVTTRNWQPVAVTHSLTGGLKAK
jgi:hypothetical protein